MIAAEMNKKNEGKRKTVAVNATAHNRIKELSKRSGVKIERLVDDALFDYLKRAIISTAP